MADGPTLRRGYLLRFPDGSYAGSPLWRRETDPRLASIVTRDPLEAGFIAARWGAEPVQAPADQ